jgi:arginine-tRNA-protein transferase
MDLLHWEPAPRVAYVDALPEALSAIYCYYDPTEGARSLGTFNILSLLASARERGLPQSTSAIT